VRQKRKTTARRLSFGGWEFQNRNADFLYFQPAVIGSIVRIVTQTFCLLYRRVALCNAPTVVDASSHSKPGRLQTWRYSRLKVLKVCVTRGYERATGEKNDIPLSRDYHAGYLLVTDRRSIGLRLWYCLGLLSFALNPGLALAQEQTASTNAIAPEPLAVPENLTNVFGSWIWADKFFNGQTLRFWRTFDIPRSAQVHKARLRMTVDNNYVLFLDGREIGRGAEWRELYDYNLTPLMSPGRHVLAIQAMNSFHYAGMLFGMRVDLADGRAIEIKSDENWRIVPEGARGWEKAAKAADSWPRATAVAPFGGEPWWSTPVNVNEMPTLQPVQVFFWQTGWFQVTLLTVSASVMLFSFWLMAQLALHKKERLLLQRERARIAMDIHDDLGSRMTQLVLHGEVAQSELPAESTIR